MSRIVVAAIVVGVVTAAVPARAQSRREMQMMADIRMLQEQTQQMQQQMQAALASLNEALAAMNKRMDDQTAATRKAFADQKLIVDELSGNLRVIRERVDETNVRIGSLSQEVEALRLSIPQTAVTAPPSPDPSTPSTAAGQPAPSPATPPAAAPIGPGMSPQRMFDTAWSDYTAGQWELCIGGFDQYIRTFPRNEMVADAYFYIGECSFSSGKFTEAVDAYNRVLAGYAKSARAPEAMYKRGLAFERLGQNDRARESYEQVEKNYPDSDAARLARQNLARLNRGRPPVE